MEHYTTELRVLIVKHYYQNGESLIAMIRKIQQNITAVRESVAENPRTSIHRRTQQLDITTATLQRILTKDFRLHPYKVQLTQQLLPIDHLQRRQFTNWTLEQEVSADFAAKIIFNDEAHFHLDGFVNRQNCRIWGSENPRMIHEKAMHPNRVTIWCALWAGVITGPFFFENKAGNAVTVNDERYCAVNPVFVPQMHDIAIDNMWFQQDGATSHTARETLAVLHETFPGRLISRFGDQN